MIGISLLTGELVFTALWLLCRGIIWIRQKKIVWKREAALLLMYVNLAVLLRFVLYPFFTVNGQVQPLIMDPDNPTVYCNIGNVYFTQGQYAAAKPLYEKALAGIEANPMRVSGNDIAVSYGNYGNCLGKLGDLEGAKKYLSLAKTKGYSRESLRNVCRQLGLNPKRL